MSDKATNGKPRSGQSSREPGNHRSGQRPQGRSARRMQGARNAKDGCGKPHDSTGAPDAQTQHVDYPMRLQKFLARAGVASRRGSENLMTAGRVKVNGMVTTELGSKVDPNSDVVEVDGIRVKWGAAPVVVLLNKPAGYVSTMKDPHARHVVAELVPTREYPGLFPIGRLDMDTTGVLLFTTDGELGHRLLGPKHGVEKTYEALVDGQVDDRALQTLSHGVKLDDGMTLPAKVRVMQSRPDATLLELVLTEGRKREVKRMCEAVGHPVLELHRRSFGTVELGDLPEGSWRLLQSAEVDALRRCIR